MGLVTTVGLSLAVITSAQVIAAVAHATAIKRLATGDTAILHRLGFAFSNLGLTAGALLVIAVLAVSPPVFAEARTTQRQEQVAATALGLVVVVAVVLAAGAVLAARWTLHANSVGGRHVGNDLRIQLAGYLIGALGTDAVAFLGSLRAMALRAGAERR